MELVSIQVVADKKLADFARQLVHGISKTEQFDASFYTLEQYRDNEVSLSSRVIRIFIGKNKVSNSYIPMVHYKYNEHGIKWGYDGNIAVIYVDGLPKDMKGFTDDFNKMFSLIQGTAITKRMSMHAVGAISAQNFIAGPIIAIKLLPSLWLKGLILAAMHLIFRTPKNVNKFFSSLGRYEAYQCRIPLYPLFYGGNHEQFQYKGSWPGSSNRRLM